MQSGQGGMNMGMGSPMGAGMGANRPGFNAQEPLAFAQQKSEQQPARRGGSAGGVPQQGGNPTSWEGMYDDVPQPNMNMAMGRGGPVRNMTPNSAMNGKAPKGPSAQMGAQSAAPANAPTGPKNAGRPGANYRGGGRGGHRGFHPYARG